MRLEETLGILFRGLSLDSEFSMYWIIFVKIRVKVEKIKEGISDSIPSLSTSVKIHIMVGKVCLRCEDKT